MIHGETFRKADLDNIEPGDSIVIAKIPAGATYLRTVDEGENIVIWWDDNNTEFTMDIG